MSKPSAPKPSGPRSGGRLNRADVLRAAMELLEEVGLQALTMRGLAGHLGVHVGGLYWHFADKRALLDAMSDQLLAAVEAPSDDLPWDDQVREIARSMQRAALSHRDGGLLLAGRFAPLEHTLRTGGLMVRALLRGGIPPESAGAASFSLLYYTLGHAIEEQSRSDLIASGQWDAVMSGIETTGTEEMAEAFTVFDAETPAARFERGLELLMAGIRATA